MECSANIAYTLTKKNLRFFDVLLVCHMLESHSCVDFGDVESIFNVDTITNDICIYNSHWHTRRLYHMLFFFYIRKMYRASGHTFFHYYFIRKILIHSRNAMHTMFQKKKTNNWIFFSFNLKCTTKREWHISLKQWWQNFFEPE